MKKIAFILSIIFSLSLTLSFSKEKDKKTIEEKESELIDFDSIKKVLKSDQLNKQVKKKTKQIKKLKNRRVLNKKLKYKIPDEDRIWSFLTEIWLIKNSSIIKWDFQKPDYGIEEAFKNFLERHGYYEKTIKILLVNTPNITHMALPSNKNEYIFLLSVPFIRTLDLSKSEISILLFEDFIRAQKGYFKKFVTSSQFKKLIGSNFEGKKFNNKNFTEVFKKYDDIVFARGFTFQQQFEVTKSVGSMLKSELKSWNVYFNMLNKIDDLVKTNILYNNYVKIFPSPELQINWLRPKRTVL